MTTTDTPVNNGVNVEALLSARAALTDAPQAAQFQWRATCEWQNGTHSRSTVEGFFGLGEEQSHRTRYLFDVDHPEIFAITTFVALRLAFSTINDALGAGPDSQLGASTPAPVLSAVSFGRPLGAEHE